LHFYRQSANDTANTLHPGGTQERDTEARRKPGCNSLTTSGTGFKTRPGIK